MKVLRLLTRVDLGVGGLRGCMWILYSRCGFDGLNVCLNY